MVSQERLSATIRRSNLDRPTQSSASQIKRERDLKVPLCVATSATIGRQVPRRPPAICYVRSTSTPVVAGATVMLEIRRKALSICAIGVVRRDARSGDFLSVMSSRVRAREQLSSSSEKVSRLAAPSCGEPTCCPESAPSKPPFWSGPRLAFHPSRERRRRRPLHCGRLDVARQFLMGPRRPPQGEEGL
jgi:hypothetical protein